MSRFTGKDLDSIKLYITLVCFVVWSTNRDPTKI